MGILLFTYQLINLLTCQLINLSTNLGKTVLKNRKGFSLIEMMVVVVIIAITIAGVVFVGQGTYRRTSVKNAARDIASLMRLASSKALSERIYYNVVLSSGNCYLEKHYSGDTDGIWEDIPASTSVDETDDNYFVIDSSPGARKKLANAVDIDDGTGTTLGLRKIAFTLKETVMGITADDVMIDATWSPSDVYSVYLDDDTGGTGNVQYLVTVDSDTARVKIYSSW
ncbi:hypothetical protein ES703_83392 [subsurface metagenome]